MYRNAPDDKDFAPSPRFETCYEWCRAQWEAATEQGDHQAAKAYMAMYEMWKARGN